MQQLTIVDPIIKALSNAIPSDRIFVGDGLQGRYTHVWHTDMPLLAKALIIPVSTEEVSYVMKLCHQYSQPVIVHGGLTNLVGSTIARDDEIVISLEKMSNIEEVDIESRAITVQAGVVLEDVQQAAARRDLLFPLNFGAKGSAQVGGIISTNAGGLRVLKYGMMRQLVLGLEVVLPDGTILCSMKKIIKDNSGYDLKQLFIGSEGTLGIVTRAILKLVEAPISRISACAGLKKYEDVVRFLKFLDKGLGGKLSAFELLWKDAFIGLTSPPSNNRPPIPYDYNYYVLMEALGSDPEADKQQLESLLGEAMGEGVIGDGAMAHNDADLQWFWNIREDVHPLLTYGAAEQSFDISIPIPLIGDTINSMIPELMALNGVLKVFPFGHVADGNIHFLICKENNDPELTLKINEIVYSPLKGIGGSVSAEHGIGLDKKRYLSLCRSEEEIAMMKTLKMAIDPKGILNPGRIFS